MAIVIERIQPEDIERLWVHVEPLIRAGCNAVTTENTAEFVKAEALVNRRTLWVVFDTDDPFPFLAACATGERLTNRGRVVFFDVIGGRNRGCWLTQFVAEIEAQAKAKGVVSIELEGRRGWRRVLPGYREVRTVMEKKL